MLKKTFFISDLHLEENRPEITQQFLLLLEKIGNVDVLYILGDFFESWIGDDDESPLKLTIMNALRAKTRSGLCIYFQHGNRDFLISNKFLSQSGCKLLNEEEKITLNGTAILLMHGDTLCTRDISYIKMRKKFRHPFMQFLFLSLPLNIRKRIAIKMRKKSANHTKSLSMSIMDVEDETVYKIMEKHQVNYLIHGHTHLPAIHQFKLNGSGTYAERIVLSAWHERGNVLVWDNTGNKKFIDVNDI